MNLADHLFAFPLRSRAARAALFPPTSPASLLAVLTAATLCGCMGTLPGPAAMSGSPPPAAAPTVASETTATRSAISYGSVTSRVEKNKTTQLELLEQFGGANITTTDADGTEVWVYERIVTQSDLAAQSKNYQGAVNLGVSFGFTNWGGSAGGSASAGSGAVQSSTTISTRTLTVIVKFNPDRTVKDYSVRATYF